MPVETMCVDLPTAPLLHDALLGVAVGVSRRKTVQSTTCYSAVSAAVVAELRIQVIEVEVATYM
jgi:hypothetical protein